MRRRRLINGTLLGLVLGLGAALWQLPAGNGDEAQLTALDPAAVHTLTLTYPRTGDSRPDLGLERREDGWHLVHPIAHAARDGRIVTALEVLAARADSCYELAEHDPADFGLESPRLRLEIDDTTLAFGDRAEDGRRYVATGGRLCLVTDRGYPLLAQGLDGLAASGLLTAGATPLRIETPRAVAMRPEPRADWRLERGGEGRSADLAAWAARWRAASAQSFALDPGDADHGRIRIETSDGDVHQWRIAQRDPELVLVPAGADYGLRIAAEQAAALLHPPAPSTTEAQAPSAEPH